MSSEEKAGDLVDKLYAINPNNGNEAAKKCALICVDEIIIQLNEMRKPEYTDFWHGDKAGETVDGYFIKGFWEEVKSIISKL